MFNNQTDVETAMPTNNGNRGNFEEMTIDDSASILSTIKTALRKNMFYTTAPIKTSNISAAKVPYKSIN